MLKIWENSILVDGYEWGPRTWRPASPSVLLPASCCFVWLSLPCQVGEEMETVQRQLKWTTTEGKGDDSVSMKFRDFVRYDAYESALQNTVIPKYK